MSLLMTSAKLLPRLLLGLLVSASALAGCSDTDTDASDCSGDKCDETRELDLCVAVRGNGQLITAHFGSLARIVENFGTIDGAAGGSSGSITIFLSESMQANKLTTTCGDRDCTDEETKARTALLMKTFPGYLEHLTHTEEAALLGSALPITDKIKGSGAEAMLDSDVAAGVAALKIALESPELEGLVNPEITTLLDESPNPEWHARDIIAGAEKLGSFAADSDRIFIRPGLLSFDGLAEKIGDAASFYAGLGPVDTANMKIFMDSCAVPGVGKQWFDVAQLPAAGGTCGTLFDNTLKDYRLKMKDVRGTFEGRLGKPVGGDIAALVSTSVLSGDTAASFVQARADYNAATEYEFKASFDDVTFGYWGLQADLDRVSRNDKGYTDLKTAKFKSLGKAEWKDVLGLSPAEPGLARALELPGSDVSAGGWSDLHPSLALNNLGCKNVVYVTRAGDESGFARGVAKLLGMSPEQDKELYDLDSNSSYNLSLLEADAVWCTNWDDMEAKEFAKITDDSYNAEMLPQSDFFGQSSYANRVTTETRGCKSSVAIPLAPEPTE